MPRIHPSHAPGLATAIGILLTCSGFATGIKAGIRIADWFILRHIYGPARVAAEHLTIVQHFPSLVCSDGHPLPDVGFYQFLIPIPCGILALALTFALTFLLPPAARTLMWNYKRRDHALFPLLAILIGIPLTMALSITNTPLPPNLLFPAAILIVAWILLGRTTIDPTLGPT